MRLDQIRKAVASPPSQVVSRNTFTAARGLSASAWFGPLEPIKPTAPAGLLPREFQYNPGQNLVFTPRGDEPIDFPVLRGLADGYDLLRSIIETWKDLACTQRWSIRTRTIPGETKAQQSKREAKDKTIGLLTDFFEQPDTEHDWSTWLRALLEDMGVIDAASVWVERQGGKVLSLRPIDGATITRYIDEQGFTPRPPLQAYAQVLYGTPAVPLTSDDLLYLVRNWRTSRLYGYSQVEQAIVTINIALRREMFTLNYYTEGNVPEAFYTMPPGVTVDQVKEFQDWFDSVLAGNLRKRRRVLFMPGDEKGSQKLSLTKEPLLKNELDDWLASFFCFLFGVSRQSLIKQMNRASAEAAGDASTEEGLRPTLMWVSNSVNRMIRAMGYTGYQLVFENSREVDVLKQAQADDLTVGKIVRINESREARGLDPDPSPEANMLGTFTPTGFVPLGQSANPQDGADGADGADKNGSSSQDDEDEDKEEPAKPQQKVSKGWVTINGQHIDIGESGLPSKAELARLSYKGGTAIEQIVATQTEIELSQGLKMPMFINSEPFDLQTKTVGVEVKTMCSQANEKITMKRSAIELKDAEVKSSQLKKTFTVVVDKRPAGVGSSTGKTRYFVREGYGSFRVSSMAEVKGIAGVKSFMGLK